MVNNGLDRRAHVTVNLSRSIWLAQCVDCHLSGQEVVGSISIQVILYLRLTKVGTSCSWAWCSALSGLVLRLFSGTVEMNKIWAEMPLYSLSTVFLCLQSDENSMSVCNLPASISYTWSTVIIGKLK